MYLYASNCCKTKLLLAKQALASGSGELPETQRAGVDVDQVWAVWEMFQFLLTCFLFLSYSACALTWHG